MLSRERQFFRHAGWTLGLPLVLLLLLLQTSSLPERLDASIYDALIGAFPAAPSDNIVVVAIDDSSLQALGRWPWPRTLHAELLDRLTDAGAGTVVIDLLLTEPSDDDPRLADAMDRHGRVVLPVHIAPAAPGGLLSQYLPTQTLRTAADELGHAHVELDADGIARGLYLYNGFDLQLWPSLALAALPASEWPTWLPPMDGSGTASYVNVRHWFVNVRFTEGNQGIATYSYADVLAGRIGADELRGKTIFVGATAAGFGDFLSTPVSGYAAPMTGVMFHAQIYNALIHEEILRRVPSWIEWSMTLLLVVILAAILPRLRPLYGVLLCAVLVPLLILSSAALMVWLERRLSIASAILLPFAAFILSSARRLAVTNSFLKSQLDVLTTSAPLSLPTSNQWRPLQILLHLKELLNARGHYLASEGRILSRSGMDDFNKPRYLARGRWRHRESESWLRLFYNDKFYILGLVRPGGEASEMAKIYLDQLTFDSIAGTSDSRRLSREMMSARIQQVTLATDRMNALQAFISNSFEHMPDGIIVTDALGVIQFANGNIERWFGEPRPSLTGMPLVRLLEGHNPKPDNFWKRILFDTLTEKQTHNADLDLNGRALLIRLAPFELNEAPSHGIIANIADISELRAQQAQHREAIDFISHDVRSPLVSQMALIEQLKRQPDPVQPDQLDQLAKLARRSYQLAEEFVQLARAEQLTETRFYECELLQVLENARDSVIEQAVQRGIRLKLEGDEDLWLMGNAELLERTIINLLTNAIKYSPPGSNVAVLAYEQEHQAVVKITDEGDGIAPEEIPFLFDRYRRQQRTEIAGVHGAGLGLSFVSVVVEKHRGQILVESELNRGSVFTLRLPLMPAL